MPYNKLEVPEEHIPCMSCLVFISIAWYIMWHEINVQVIFAE
jgi:hypothetical protein